MQTHCERTTFLFKHEAETNNKLCPWRYSTLLMKDYFMSIETWVQMAQLIHSHLQARSSPTSSHSRQYPPRAITSVVSQQHEFTHVTLNIRRWFHIDRWNTRGTAILFSNRSNQKTEWQNNGSDLLEEDIHFRLGKGVGVISANMTNVRVWERRHVIRRSSWRYQIPQTTGKIARWHLWPWLILDYNESSRHDPLREQMSLQLNDLITS